MVRKLQKKNVTEMVTKLMSNKKKTKNTIKKRDIFFEKNRVEKR